MLEAVALFILIVKEVSMSLKLEVVGPIVELESGYVNYVE